MKKVIFIWVWALCAASVQAAAGAKCANFKSQAEAQAWHEAHLDISTLDRDKDGEACECLPGGSAEGNPICRLNDKKPASAG